MAEKTVVKEALQKVEDRLDCAVCLQPYTKPKLLPCFHVFCEHCLQRIVTRGQDKLTITCPKCRQISRLPANGVAALQPAFYISHLFDIRDTLQKSEKTQCEKCKKATASGFCRDCGEFVCEKCIEMHQLWKEFTEHRVVSLSEVQTEASSLTPPKKKVLYCSRHETKKLKIYCETCKELICNDCTVRLHKDHQYDLVSDAFPKHRDEMQAHLQPVKRQLDTVNKALRDFDQCAKDIGDQRTAIEGEIHQQIDQLHRALDRRRGELIGQLDQLTQQKLKNLAARRDQVEMVHAQLSSCLEYVEGSLKTSTPAEILATKEPAVRQIQGLTTPIGPGTLAPGETATMKLVTADDDLEQQCRKHGTVQDQKVDPSRCNVSGAGSKAAIPGEQTSLTLQTVDKEGKEVSIPVKDIAAKIIRCTNNATVACAVKRKDKGKYTVTYTPTTRGRHQLHIKVGQTPIGCSPLPVMVTLPPQRLGNPVRTIGNFGRGPYGIAIGNGGQMYVTESDANKIHILSREGQILKSLDHVQGPWGVCLDSDGNFFVVGYRDHRVHKFTPNGEHLQSVGSPGFGPLQFICPVGIVYSVKDEKFYISDSGNTRIQVLNKDLTFSTTFGTRGSGNGQFSDPSGMAVDSTGNMYVADCGNNRIQVFTAQGQFVRTFGTRGSAPGQLSGPRDVYIDETDTVYVAEQNNGRVSVFTAQGQFLTSFGQGHLGGPLGLTMDEDGFIAVTDLSKKLIYVF